MQSLTGTYLLKAVGFNGAESLNPALAVSTVANLSAYNAIESINEEPTFAGVKTDTVVVSGALELDGTLTGMYEFDNEVDLGAVYTSRLTATIAAAGRDLSTTIDDIANIDLVENWDGGVDPSKWGVVLQLRYTTDNPAGAPTWSEWQDFIIGDFTARAYQFRAILTSGIVGVTPTVTTLQINVDMPDYNQANKGLTSHSTDTPTVVLFPTPFKVLAGIGISINDLDSGDTYKITGPSGAGDPDETGFGIICKDSTATRVTRTFGYVAKGGGVKL